MVYKCACGCGLNVPYSGNYRKACIPAGKRNPPRKDVSDNMKKKRLDVKTAAAVADLEYPALTTQQMEDATTKALLSFNKKHLQVGELNERKVIVVSIAVVGEGQHPSTGRKVGKSIEREMQTVSLWSTGMANIIRLVTHKGVSYYENPSLAETKALGDPGELIFDAKRNKQLAMHIEKAMQVYVLHRQLFTQEKIKLLQLTADSRE
jgi:hypothetical protein